MLFELDWTGASSKCAILVYNKFKGKYMKNNAFSLIELMVVVAIISILSAVALPVYMKYSIRSRVITAFAIIQSISQQIQNYYALNGVFPTSVTFNGVVVSNTWTQVNGPGNIYSFFYGADAGGTSATIAANLSGLSGIPNYIDPVVHGVSPNGSGASAVVYAIREFNGTFKSVCGQSGGGYSGEDIPLQYLPQTCQCTDVNSYSYYGTLAPGC